MEGAEPLSDHKQLAVEKGPTVISNASKSLAGNRDNAGETRAKVA